MFLRRDSEKSKEKEDRFIQQELDKSVRREQRIIKGMFQPLMPSLCTRLYQCLLIFTVLAVIIEMIIAFRYRNGIIFTLSDLLVALVALWSLVGSLLLICSLIQLIRIKQGFKEKEYFFANELNSEDLAMCQCIADDTDNPELILYTRDPAEDPAQRYKKYIITAVLGIALLWAVLFLAFVNGLLYS